MRYLTEKMIESKLLRRFTYPKDMDEDMIDLCDVINSIPGCRTLYSCQGHGAGDWYLVIECASTICADHLVRYFRDDRHLDVRDGLTPSLFTGSCVPEYRINIYDKSFDKKSAAERKRLYKEICSHLIEEFVPRNHWR